MGDLFANRKLSQVRSVWTKPLDETESDLPAQRIIHVRAFRPHGQVRISRIGIQDALGYHKCGSWQDNDWIVDLRILNKPEPNQDWETLAVVRGLEPVGSDQVHWLEEIPPFETCGLQLEIRRCGIDGGWTPWNLAAQAFILEGEPLTAEPVGPRKEEALTVDVGDMGSLPEGLEVEISNGTIHFRSAFLQVGFFLNRTGFSYLAVDPSGSGKTNHNILKVGPASFHQGSLFAQVGHVPTADRLVRYQFDGRCSLRSNRVIYQIENAELGMKYELDWEILPDKLNLEIVRELDRELEAWQSSAWSIATAPTVSACHALGELDPSGQTGLLKGPLVLHAPMFGSLKTTVPPDGAFRSEVYRPLDRIDWEIKIQEQPTPEGTWLLPAGNSETSWTFAVHEPDFTWKPETPEAVREALRHCGYTALNFRADTATLTNNGASMHCPISMDNWSTQTKRMESAMQDISPNRLLRYSLERWLDGGPGYASGNLKADGSIHPAEDEYLMTGAAAIMGLADYLDSTPHPEWIAAYEQQIRTKMEEMLARDLDGDGLIESPYRTGVSGTAQWSTVWFDVISYGWKDAWTNAILYEALVALAHALQNTVLADWADEADSWATRLKANYASTFYNEKTGWLAGWRCKEGKLHDFAFLPPNGTAVGAGLIDPEPGKIMLQALLDEARTQGMPSAQQGLPGNLWTIPDEDRSDILQGYPFGYYQNGGRTHAQARHFLKGLYVAGLTEAADQLLEELCYGIVHAGVIGGCNSGVDWRFWDGRPCGYEGLLTDQFGFLAIALERWALEES